MRECLDDEDRARCALTMLLQRMESFAGYLYGLDDGRLVLLAGLPERVPEAEMHAWLDSGLQSELAAEVEATATGEDEQAGSDTADGASYVDADGRSFEALWLTARTARHQSRLAGVLAFHVAPGPRTPPDRRLLDHIAAQLLDEDP
jgi:hypothetical protein